MSIGVMHPALTTAMSVNDFGSSNNHAIMAAFPGDYDSVFDIIESSITETADDGSATNQYASILSNALDFSAGRLQDTATIDVSREFFAAHVGSTITFVISLTALNPLTTPFGFDGEVDIPVVLKLNSFNPLTIFNDYLGITRTVLAIDQAASIAKAIDASTTTEAMFVNGLVAQVANTTIPAVAVEASMYLGATGTSDEITKLVTAFLPAQIDNAIQSGLNPQVYACEVLGLAFAFGNENGAKNI